MFDKDARSRESFARSRDTFARSQESLGQCTSGSRNNERERKQPDTNMEWEKFIELYFEMGLKYSEIKTVLSSRHGFEISERHLKRFLSERGLSRRKDYSDLAVLVDFIRNQLQHSGLIHGYSWMYTKCRECGLRVRKEDVRLALKELDPRGVTLRKAGLIQDELDDTAQVWNAHIIRPSKNTNVPSGRPNVMYALPQLYGTRDFLSSVEDEHLQLCKDECVFRVPIPCDPDVYELCHICMAQSHLTLPTDPYQAVSLYLHLREAITASL